MIFIDGGNLFKGAKKEGISINFSDLITCISKDYNLIRTYYYTGIPHKKVWDKDHETEEVFTEKLNKQKGFLEGLEFNHNFHVTTKPLVLINGKR